MTPEELNEAFKIIWTGSKHIYELGDQKYKIILHKLSSSEVKDAFNHNNYLGVLSRYDKKHTRELLEKRENLFRFLTTYFKNPNNYILVDDLIILVDFKNKSIKIQREILENPKIGSSTILESFWNDTREWVLEFDNTNKAVSINLDPDICESLINNIDLKF